ncbi:hypothetical protein NXV81_13605 [Bacteroides ovatus]|nr:hypothetical protein [Bacteroides ovatus]
MTCIRVVIWIRIIATIQEAIDTAETPKDIEGYLKRCTLYVEEDLLNGPLVKKSTNPMSNIPIPWRWNANRSY